MLAYMETLSLVPLNVQVEKELRLRLRLRALHEGVPLRSLVIRALEEKFPPEPQAKQKRSAA
jgi:hypothetical protein